MPDTNRRIRRIFPLQYQLAVERKDFNPHLLCAKTGNAHTAIAGLG